MLECNAILMADMSKISVRCRGTPWNIQIDHSPFQGESKALLEFERREFRKY
jgi:hypothetical protein